VPYSIADESAAVVKSELASRYFTNLKGVIMFTGTVVIFTEEELKEALAEHYVSIMTDASMLKDLIMDGFSSHIVPKQVVDFGLNAISTEELIAVAKDTWADFYLDANVNVAVISFTDYDGETHVVIDAHEDTKQPEETPA
jgi:hypothetical protein